MVICVFLSFLIYNPLFFSFYEVVEEEMSVAHELQESLALGLAHENPWEMVQVVAVSLALVYSAR